MHIRNGRKYKLNCLMVGCEEVGKFMEGGTIIESRVNRSLSSMESFNIKKVQHIYSGNKAEVPKDAMVYFEWDRPSFMFEKNGKEYVVSINPVDTPWTLWEVEYIDEL